MPLGSGGPAQSVTTVFNVEKSATIAWPPSTRKPPLVFDAEGARLLRPVFIVFGVLKLIVAPLALISVPPPLEILISKSGSNNEPKVSTSPSNTRTPVPVSVWPPLACPTSVKAVSYTHLTLPTILLV